MSYWESTGASDEWYTPPHIFAALGNPIFDLDVANAAVGGAHVLCWDRYAYGGLDRPWSGFVWMNPPFGGRNGLAPWLEKFFEHGNGIALTPDRTSAPWFRAAWLKADAILFTPKQKFYRPDGTRGDSPSNGTALLAAGPRAVIALRRAARSGLGILALPDIAPCEAAE